jgi:glycosyltransferase involved in cell wall biosynthesis
MNNKNISLSIGISIYNEEANIKKLLLSLLKQEQTGFYFKEIIVISDGSVDNSVEEVRSIKDKRIKIFDFHKRMGKPYRLNQLLRKFTGDIFIILDADVLIKDNRLFARFIKQSDVKRDGLVSADSLSLSPRTFIEKVLNVSNAITQEISEKWNEGDNYISFRGRFLAFEKNFAKTIKIPDGMVNDDAFLYFLAKQKGFKPKRLKNLAIFFKSPTTFSDHLKQSSRFQYSKKELENYFKTDLTNEYRLPIVISMKTLLKYFLKNPIYVFAYVVILCLTKIMKEKNLSSAWNVSGTTKKYE